MICLQSILKQFIINHYMEKIKDQQRLFQKLFVSPTSHNHSHLIVSMQFLKLLLDQAQQLTLSAHKHLLMDILQLFQKQPANSLLLYKHDCMSVDQTPLLSMIVANFAKVIRTHQQIEEILTHITPLLSYYPIGLLHISQITRELSIQFQQGSFNTLKSKFYHSILQKYYGMKQILDTYPSSFFFLYGCNENSVIQSPQNIKIGIKNEMSVVIIFKLLKAVEQEINLVSIGTNHEILVFKIGQNISIVNETTGQRIIDEESIKENRQYCLIYSLTNLEASIHLNGEQLIKEKKGLMKKQKDRYIVDYFLGENFVGFISTFLIFDRVVPSDIFKDFGNAHRWKKVIHLKQLQPTVAVSCFPFSTFELREATHCFDIFRKSHSIIGDNIVIFQNPYHPLGIAYLGNYQVLLPLFYLARFYESSKYPDHLQKLLKIWLTALENFKDPQNLDKFLIILGHHLQALPSLLTDTCVNTLSLIYQKLSPSNKIRFLRHVGWSGLPGKSNGPCAKTWLYWLTKLYQNNKSQCLRSYGLMDVVFWLVKYLQNNFQHCCPYHYLNQSKALRQFSFEQLIKIEGTTKKLHFEAVQNIAAVILEYAIIDNPEKAIRQVKGVLRLLLHKYSNCFYLSILNILKRQTAKFKDNPKEVSRIFLAANILPFLAALAQKVVDYSILEAILFLMLFVTQFQQSRRVQIVQFFTIVLRRLKDIHHQNFNLLSHGARKVRKRSFDDTSTVVHPIADIVQRLKHYKSNFGQIKFLLVNYCVGAIDDSQFSKQTKLVEEKGFILLRHFLPLASQQLKRQLLEKVRDKVVSLPINCQFCLHSIEFTRLLLSVIEQEISKAILIEIIQWQLKKKINLGQYYIQVKNISRSQANTAEIFCEIFLNLLTKRNYKFSLTQFYQILLIMSHQNKQQIEPKDYWLLISLITRNISSTIKYNLFQHITISLQTNPLELIDRVKSLDPQILEGTHFQLQVYSIGQEEVNFLFDILLPKVLAGINVNTFLEDTKRTVYIFQIYVYQSIQAIQNNMQKRGQHIPHLVQNLIALLTATIIRRQEETDKSFLRMMLFFISGFLLRHNQVKQLHIIWNFMIAFLRQFAKRSQSHSYSGLRQALNKQSIQPFILQIFEVFLRVSNQQYLVSFQDIMQASNLQKTETLLKQKIVPLLQIKQFHVIYESCKRNAFQKLYKKYQQNILSQQAKLDIQLRAEKSQNLFQAVEKIFQQESIGQQQTRLKYLHEHQNFLRQYHSSWNQLWNRLRIYYQPYGIFNAQKNSINNFMFQSDKMKNYRFKMSQYSSASGIQPILQAQILQPWHVRKTIQQENKNELNNLVQLMRPNQANKPKKNSGVMSSVSSFLRRISGDRQLRTYNEYQVLWIKQGRKARGKITLNEKDEIVFWYESLKQADSHLAFQKFSLLFNEQMVRSWRIDEIRKVIEKRYLMRYSALQLVLPSRKSLLFYFQDNRHHDFLQQLQKIRTNKIQGIGSKLKLNKIPFYLDDWYQDQLPSKVTEDWRNRKISNLQYLIAVNKAASRGIYDISQYPVLPWVCQMKEQKQPTLRDLTKTMGGLGSQERKRIASQKYSAADPFNPVPPFHFGTHYSSPGVVFNFLIRLAPFTDYCKNLQGGKFDIPDRLFASLVQAWRSAYSELSDVRELVPQFYYIPECLLNIEKLHLGETQSGQTIDHVELPPWAANNPYFFTTQMRQMLQSQQCSSAINHWIDLLFGIKQRGQAAKQNYNIYYYLTYEDYSNCLTQTQDEVYRKSCEAQIMHFGQIPPQIFQKEHPKRMPKVIQPVQLRISQKVQLMNAFKEKIIGAHRSGNQLTLIKRNLIEVLSLGKSPAVLTRNYQFNFQRTISKSLYAIKRQQAKIIFFRNYFLIYGYTTNQFRIFNKSNGSLEFHQSITSKIQHAIISEDQSLILFGSRSGVLYIFEIQYDTKLFAKQVHIETFPHPISHISENDGFFTISFGCYVSIYKFQRSLYYLSKDITKPFVKLFRSFHNSLPVKGAFIADIPLYCLILFDKANVKIYSINGQLIKILSCNPKSMYALKDKQLNSLFCVIEEGRLLLLSTPDLRCISELEVGGALQILDQIIVYEKKIHFISC